MMSCVRSVASPSRGRSRTIEPCPNPFIAAWLATAYESLGKAESSMTIRWRSALGL